MGPAQAGRVGKLTQTAGRLEMPKYFLEVARALICMQSEMPYIS